MAEKHDVFVGNVTFNTTEEQLQEIFSFVGPIKNIRILTDQNTGRPKGFAFIEYSDANTALAAIRHLDGHELNNRKLRVSYSNNSNLKEIARSIGQVIPDIYQSHISTKQEYQAGKGWRRNIVCCVVVLRFEDESSIKCSILLFSPLNVISAQHAG
jgi:cleavage stimulation factor subunit 2